MNLSVDEIAVRPSDYQRRKTPFAEQTVEAIVAEGYDGAKFDPIPVARIGGQWGVAGDGHSRLEALKRLRAAGREAPDEVPVRVVSAEQGAKLADTANVSRTAFTAVEEAKIIRRRLANGEQIEYIARSMHRSVTTARCLVSIASLSESLQDLVGKEYGLTTEQASRFGRAAEKFGWSPHVQWEVWVVALKDADLTDRVFSVALEVIGQRLAGQKREDGMLFDLPPSVRCVVRELNALYMRISKARTALRSLRRHADVFRDADLVRALGEPVDRELVDLETRMEREAARLGDTRPTNRAAFGRKMSAIMSKHREAS